VQVHDAEDLIALVFQVRLVVAPTTDTDESRAIGLPAGSFVDGTGG
jgi:hypothetical protein